ncbi:unnamed protein product [Sympodiomycopsis kandeliae]
MWTGRRGACIRFFLFVLASATVFHRSKMSASPARAEEAMDTTVDTTSPAEPQDQLNEKATSPSAEQDAEQQTKDGAGDDDDLFGDDDDDEENDIAKKASGTSGAQGDEEDDDDDDDDDIIPSARRRKRAVGSGSPGPSSAQQSSGQKSGLPTFDDDEAMEERSVDDEEAARLAALEYGEDGQPMGARGDRSPSPPEADNIATISLPSTAQNFTPSHLLRLPLFLRVNPQQFEHDRYISEREAVLAQEEEEADLDEKTKDVERRLRCENTVRWKVDKETGDYQSNARFVKWSDGSWTLQVGKEQFDINGLDSRYTPGSSNVATPANANGSHEDPIQSQGASQGISNSKSQTSSASKRGPSQPLTYLATPTWPDAIFQTISPLHSNISIQPTSLHSATHRLISQNLSSIRARQGASKVHMSELVAGEKAPEELKRERERKLLDDERKKRLRKKKERGGDIEAEEEAELMGLLKGRRKTLVDSIKKASTSSKRRGVAGRSGRRVEDYDDDDDEEDEDEEGNAGYLEDDADGFIVNDEDDDDSGKKRGNKKKSRKSDDSSEEEEEEEEEESDEDEEMDDLDKADAAIGIIEAQEKKAKQQSQGGEGISSNSQKKKKAIVESDDDDDDDE